MQIIETVQFLAAFSPAELNTLKKRHPSYRAMLEPGGEVLGKAEEAALLDIVRTSIRQMAPVADQAMAETGRKLRATRKLELAGSLLALVSTGGVIGATIGFESLWGGALMGALGFISAAVPLIVGWLRGVSTGEETVAENFIRLREAVFDARFLEQEIATASNADPKRPLIERGNAIARTMFTTLSNLGFDNGLYGRAA